LLNHCATPSDDRGYGSLRSQGRRKRVQVSKQHRFAFSRHDAPELCWSFRALKSEGAGNAGCALHPRSRVQNGKRKRTRAYRFSGGNPTFPAQWLYGLLRALPGDRACLTPSPSGYGTSAPGRADMPPKDLTPTTEASGPHDFTVRSSTVRQRAV
jgi:hypothetical protein